MLSFISIWTALGFITAFGVSIHSEKFYRFDHLNLYQYIMFIFMFGPIVWIIAIFFHLLQGACFLQEIIAKPIGKVVDKILKKFED